ncbi:MAG: hypothetical protein ACI4JJ_08375 [Huintestinicola sp.]
MESEFVRDQNFELNNNSMREVRKRFRISFGYNFGSAFALFFLSGYGLLYWLFSGTTDIVADLLMDYEITGYQLNPWIITMPLSIAMIVCTMLGCRYFRRKANFVNYILFAAYFILGLLCLGGIINQAVLGGRYFFGFFMMAYSMAGIWTTDLAQRNFKELDYLVTQEGFPDFDLNMNYMGRSRYVKMRERWLKKEKKFEYYSPSEKPEKKYYIVPDENKDKMESLSIDSENKDNWFTKGEQAKTTSENLGIMDEIATDFSFEDEPSEQEPQEKDDIRRKPL